MYINHEQQKIFYMLKMWKKQTLPRKKPLPELYSVVASQTKEFIVLYVKDQTVRMQERISVLVALQ